jgi:hypothetical protein
MTIYDVIDMAHEATKHIDTNPKRTVFMFGPEELEMFASLVAEKQKAECAEICANIEKNPFVTHDAKGCEMAIKAMMFVSPK